MLYNPVTDTRCIATFSLVGFDPTTEEIGVAVQSKFPSVGAMVPWVKAGVGAVATQAWANTSYGPNGLDLLAQGLSPSEVIDHLTGADEGFMHRQVGIVDATGRSASFTGSECMDFAGGITGPNFAAQGNILVSRATVEALADTFTTTEGDLADRLTLALLAGQAAGGDARGMQAAALYIAKEGGGYGGFTDRYVDIRVDEHPSPIKELRRILALERILLFTLIPGNTSKLEGETLRFITARLIEQGYLPQGSAGPWDATKQKALEGYCAHENYEERLTEFGTIDNELLDYLQTPADNSADNPALTKN